MSTKFSINEIKNPQQEICFPKFVWKITNVQNNLIRNKNANDFML